MMLWKFKKKNNFDCIEIERCFNNCSNIFLEVNSEYKRFKILKDLGFVKPEKIIVGKRFVKKNIYNKDEFVSEIVRATYIPLRVTFKYFLEVPGIFHQIMEYVNTLGKESTVISNIMQAQLWNRKYAKKFENQIVLPFYLFWDELEVGNPLGSHAGNNKFGALYTSIACLPKYLASKLNSIFLVLLMSSENKKKITNQQLFEKIVEETNFLQSQGITVQSNSKTYNVKFQLMLILGDNLGLNSICGFVESFKANYCCRVCKIHSNELVTCTKEINLLIRTCENYEIDLKEGDFRCTGLKEPCIFNQIDNFHIVENISVDMMHDILEGVCVYDLQLILRALMNTCFSLNDLNSRIANFKFGFENSNRPQKIMYDKVKSKICIKMSAAVVLCLVRYLGVIIGELVPENNEFWELFKLLRQIIDIVTSPRLTECHIKKLEELAVEHNNMYLHLFETLKPKFHYLLHYARILKENGPCVHYWSMRYESRHRPLKSSALSTCCNKDLASTIAIKEAFRMCHIYNEFDLKTIKWGSIDVNRVEITSLHNILLKYKEPTTVTLHKEVEINGTLYTLDTYLVTNIEEVEKDFAKIIKIINIGNIPYFYMDMFKEEYFDSHYHAYRIRKVQKKKLFQYEDLPFIAPCLFIKIKDAGYITTRYVL